MIRLSERARTAAYGILAAYLFICSGFARAAAGQETLTVDTVAFVKAMRLMDTDFTLAGAGLHRYRIVFRGYAAALYLGTGEIPASVFKDIPKRLEIEYYHAIPAAGFIDATREGMKRNVSRGDLGRMRPRMERLFRAYHPVRPQDRYAFTYVPGKGSTLTLNNVPLDVFEGLDFANAFLSIWIGPEPADEGLKRALLKEP